MSNILKIQELYDYYNDSYIGYLGIDLASKEVNLYFDDKRKNIEGFKRLGISSLSKKGQILVISSLKKQLQYSKNNGLQISDIENIINGIEFVLEDNRIKDDLRYNPLSNSLLISNIQSLVTDNNTKEDNQQCLNSLLFGLGEMKVSSIFLDEENRKVIIKMGFYEQVIDIEEIRECEDDNKFIILSSNDLMKNKNGRVLESIFNDLECREIDEKYQSVIKQKYGLLLDHITGGKLRHARLNGGISSFHEVMNEIIPDSNLSEELLDLIENEHSDDEVYKLLNIYTQEIIKNWSMDEEKLLLFINKCLEYGASINIEELKKDNILIKKLVNN